MMVNQQATLSTEDAIDIGYIAGALDGEGSIGFQLCKHKGLANQRYSIRTRICNTDKRFCERIYFSLKRLNLPCYFEENGQRYSGSRRLYKKSYTVGIYGMKRNEVFLKFIMPYLTTKFYVAHYCLKYIELRKSQPFRDPLTTLELEYVEKVKKWNSNSKGAIRESSETNEQNNVMSVEDRVHLEKVSRA